MVFSKNSAKGKAGENYFSYWILRNFGWPCRLLDIDIGIDAQIEVLNENKRPTGNFLPVQIKTTESKELKMPISTDHLNQWSMMNESVLLVLIDFKFDVPHIYYKEINSEEIQSKLADGILKGKGSKLIWFNEQDLLTVDLKNKFTSISYSNLDEKIKKDALEIISKVNENIMYFEVESDRWRSFCFHEFDYTNVIDDYDCCCFLNDDIENAILRIPNLSFVCDSINLSIEKFQDFTLGIQNLLCELNGVDESYEHKKEMIKDGMHFSLRKLIEENMK